MRIHEVQPGESLTGVAVANGFTKRARVLEHPDNEEVRTVRPNPNLLRPGDRIAVPDLERQEVACATRRRHRFVVDLPVLELRVQLRGHDGTKLANTPYLLELTRELRSGTTDGEGMLEERLSILQRSAHLTIGDRVLVLRFSTLGPVGDEADPDLRDLQSRLHNLGFDIGPSDGVYGRRTRAALAVFQAEQGLRVTGEPDAATRAALEDAHGC